MFALLAPPVTVGPTPTVAGGGTGPGSIPQIAATPEPHTHTRRNIIVT